MKFELVSKTAKEIVDTVDLANVGVTGARTYFMGRKQLKDKEFDKLFSIRKHPFIGRYHWWKEEKAITDDELKLF